MTLQLRDYQEKRLLYHLSKDRSIELLLPGRGKSPIFACYTKIQYECFKEKSVWVQPTALLEKNRQEILDWTGWAEDEVVCMNVTKAKREKLYKNHNIKVFLMSGDMYGKEWKFLPEGVNVVICDECHQILGSHTSQRTQSFYVSSRRFKKMKFLSGSILAGKYSSLYPPLAMVEPRYYCNYENFLRFHAVYNTFNQIVAWRNPERITEILKRESSGLDDPFAGRKDLKQIIFEKCNFDEAHKKAYMEMEEYALVELEDAYIDAHESGGVKAIRCRQILSCPEALGIKIGYNGKDEMLKVHLLNAKEENERILIFSSFVAEQERAKKLCDSLGVRAEIMNGSTPSDKRGILDKKFRNGEIDVLICSEQVGSLGFNFEFVKEIIFLSMSYNNTTVSQAIARGDRGSRTRPLLVYILTFDCKIEKRIIDILQRKSNELKRVFTS